MISSLLPGFRETRAEFASGALWVVFAWLLVGDRAVRSVETSNNDGLASLISYLNGVGGTVVLAMASLLAGSVWTTLVDSSRLTQWLRHIDKHQSLSGDPENPRHYLGDIWRPFSYTSLDRLDRQIHGLMKERGLLHLIDSEKYLRWRRLTLRQALFSAPAVLASDRDASSEMYAEYVRVKAEGEMRDAVFIPLALAMTSAILSLDLACLEKTVAIASVLVVSASLFIVARRQTRNANSQIIHWLAKGSITTTSMDRLDEHFSEEELAD